MLRETEALLARYRAAGKRIATAESCTGGLIAGCLTEIAGSSDVVDRGFVTYSNAAKSEMLGVSPTLLEHPGPGAVSAEGTSEERRGGKELVRTYRYRGSPEH